MFASIRSAWALGRFVVQHPLNRANRAKALSSAVRWQLGSRVLRAPIVLDWVGGARLIVGRGMAGATGNLYAGLHEYADMAFVLHYLRSTDLVLDIGANVGSYTVLAGAACGARVVCFEPVPATYAHLVDNVRINALGDRVQALNVAVGETAGTVAFTVGQDATNHVVAGHEKVERQVEVPVVRLDDLDLPGRVSLIKIDVEGFEMRVLRGGSDTLARTDVVLMELNGSGLRYGVSDAAIADEMTLAGFVPRTYCPTTRSLTAVDPLDAGIRGGNVIFVRDDRLVGERAKCGPTHSVGDRLI